MTYSMVHHKKIDGRSLWLFSEERREYVITNDLPPVDEPSQPIKRFHPLRGEDVYFNPGRNTRTLNPPPDYNPLAPVAEDGFPGEIPVTDFEVAIFQNRWPGLSDLPFETDQAPAYGRCEVVVYTTNATGSVGDLTVQRIELLLQAVAERQAEILKDERISVVIPFENRGAFVGTSLPHPHGQIYALETLPPSFERQVENVRENKVLLDLVDSVDDTFWIEDRKKCKTFCPPFARYPFETWIMPKRPVASPADMTEPEIKDFAQAVQAQVKRFDTVFGEPMPYVMWHAFAPRGAEADWPYHIQFWPLQRGEGKMKYLAGVEQIAQIFLVDVMPEDAAAQFRGLSV